jgi:23S rRNA (cytosine1962-C5)-methyltransferase
MARPTDRPAPRRNDSSRPDHARPGNRAQGQGHPDSRGRPDAMIGKAPPRRPRQDAAPLPANLAKYPGAASVVLRPGTSTPVLAGHPWIFSGAVAHVVTHDGQPPVAGMPCAVFDPHGRFLGHGTYNPASQIAVRVVEPGLDGLEPQKLPDTCTLVRARLKRAAELRAQVGLPSAETTAYRMVNSEGDGMPGLMIDRYGDGAVVAVSSAGADRWLPHLVEALQGEHGCAWVLARVPTDIHPSEGLVGGRVNAYGDVPLVVEVQHNGLKMRVEPAAGQKTGMYIDQRDNHKLVGGLAKGRFVLDAFSHTGGFGLHCARQGAKRVVCVDASQRAVDLVLAHAEDNGLMSVEAECADAVHVLRHYAELEDEGAKPSLVVVDPPKFATRTAAVEQALKKYGHVNQLAMQAVQPGGLLVTCSCSGLVDRQAFLRMLAQAAHAAGRVVQLLDLRGAGMDHPVAPAHPEGAYLKVAVLRVTVREA